MALTKDYEIAVLEVIPDGAAFLALRLCVVEDGIMVGTPTNYRAGFSNATEVPDALNTVNQHLTSNGYPELGPEDAAFITETISAARTNPGKAVIPLL